MTGKKTTARGKQKKTVNTEPAQSVQEAVTINKQPENSWNIGSVFWGLLFVVIGGLLLLGNLGVVEVSWGELWRLWPLFIVATGFSLLATSHWLWKLLSIVFVIVALFFVVWVGTGQYATETKSTANQNVSVRAAQGVSQAEVTVKAGASKLTVKSKDIAEVVVAELDSQDLQIDKHSSREGAVQKILLTGSKEGDVWFGAPQNNWDITVSQRLPMKLNIDAGASRLDADLSRVQLTDLVVKAGASQSVITLGDRQSNLNVSIDSGASSTTLRIPKSSAVTVEVEGGLSTRQFEDLKKVSEEEYRSDNYQTAAKRISIKANTGLALFKIERY